MSLYSRGKHWKEGLGAPGCVARAAADDHELSPDQSQRLIDASRALEWLLCLDERTEIPAKKCIAALFNRLLGETGVVCLVDSDGLVSARTPTDEYMWQAIVSLCS